MYTKITCACGQLVTLPKAGVATFCPSCGAMLRDYSQSIQAETPPPTKTSSEPSGIIVYGLDPPAARPWDAELAFRPVLVAEEKIPKTPSAAPPAQAPPTSSDSKWSSGLSGLWDLDSKPRRRFEKPIRRHPVLEQDWYECLVFPMQHWLWVLGLGFGLTLMTAMFLGLLGLIRQTPIFWIVSHETWFLFALAALGSTCTFCFFGQTLRSGVRGEVGGLRWPKIDVRLLINSALTGLVTVVAGPILPAVVAVYFWVYAGQLTIIDRLILLELGFMAVGYGLLVFLALVVGERWTDAHPNVVLTYARRLDWRGRLAVVIASCIASGHLWLAGKALAQGPFFTTTWFLLLFCWTSLVFWMTFLLRWLGICWFQKKVAGTPVNEPT